jgi:hypothetical protein
MPVLHQLVVCESHRLANVIRQHCARAYDNAGFVSLIFAFAESSNFRDPENRDENIDYYIAKLDELVKKFGGITADASSVKQQSLEL